MKKKEKVIDALNRIDELACAYANNNNEVEGTGKGEAEILAEDYNLVFDYIMKCK